MKNSLHRCGAALGRVRGTSCARPGLYGDMAAAAARCFRAMPTARSMLHLSRNRAPSTTVVLELLPRPGCAPHQAMMVEELMAKLVGPTGVVGADALAWTSARNGKLSAVVPKLEAVNRNARRPKKVRCMSRTCARQTVWTAGWMQALCRGRVLFRGSRQGHRCAVLAACRYMPFCFSSARSHFVS